VCDTTAWKHIQVFFTCCVITIHITYCEIQQKCRKYSFIVILLNKKTFSPSGLPLRTRTVYVPRRISRKNGLKSGLSPGLGYKEKSHYLGNTWILLQHIHYRHASVKKGKGNPYSITDRIEFRSWSKVLVSQPAGDVSHKPGGRLPLFPARPAATSATLKTAATNFAAWWAEARWMWTVCLRLLPDSVAAAIWTRIRRACNTSSPMRTLAVQCKSEKDVYSLTEQTANCVFIYCNPVSSIHRVTFIRA